MSEAITIERLQVEIRAETIELLKDVEKIKQQFRDVQKSANNLSSGIRRSFKKMAGMISIAFAGLKIGQYIKNSIKTAMNAIESESLFDTVMGRWSKSVRAWSMELQRDLGLNGYEIRKNVATLFNMTKSMGVAEMQALKMSKSMVVLANDMASFYNLSTEDAFNKIKAGITGEAEPLKSLGILIDENTIKNVAWQNGLVGVGGQLDAGQK